MFCDTHFYLNLSSLGAKISARCRLCHKPSKCYSIVSCSPLILIGPHFLSLAINQLYDLSLFQNIVKKRPCSEINAFKNSDPELRLSVSQSYTRWCAAKALFSCPAIISQRLESRIISNEPLENTEEESKII